MDIEGQIRWLRIVASITIFFGLLTTVAAYPAANGFIIWLADLMVWPIDGAQTGLDSTARLMFAIGGGIFIGFGAMWLAIAGAPYRAAPKALRHVLIIGAVTWFVSDSVGSVLAEAAFNILGNIGFLAMLLWPIRRAAA